MAKKRQIGEVWEKSLRKIDYRCEKLPDGKIKCERISPYINEDKKPNKYKRPEEVKERFNRGNPTRLYGHKKGDTILKSKDHTFNPETHEMVPHPTVNGAFVQRLKS